MGKSTISMAMFNSYVSNYQRATIHSPAILWSPHEFTHSKWWFSSGGLPEAIKNLRYVRVYIYIYIHTYIHTYNMLLSHLIWSDLCVMWCIYIYIWYIYIYVYILWYHEISWVEYLGSQAALRRATRCLPSPAAAALMQQGATQACHGPVAEIKVIALW